MLCYDWAIAQHDAVNCIISDFYVQLDKYVFYYLLMRFIQTVNWIFRFDLCQ